VKVDIISAEDVYGESEGVPTPAGFVLAGKADVAFCPSETVISGFPVNVDEGGIGGVAEVPEHLVAVAAALHKDTSAIVALGGENAVINRPRDLDGRRYGSYSARYEGRIVQEMIRNDGGKGEFKELTPSKLGIFGTLQSGDCDATWVFMLWEGIHAQRQGLRLNAFALDEYGIQYGYTPVLVVRRSAIDPGGSSDTRLAIQRFLEATSQGYEACVESPREAAALFMDSVRTTGGRLEYPEDTVYASFEATSGSFKRNGGNWGEMELSRWNGFLDWLSARNLLTEYKQSRSPDADKGKVTLDDLRAGKAGAPIPREKYRANMMFTNNLLPLSSSL